MTPELAANIRKAVSNAGDKVAFRIRRRDFWGGRWLKHVQASSYYLRLFRPEKMRYERLVNPVSVPLGPVGDVEGFLDHHPFSKGMTRWLARHNSYSSLEAEQILEESRRESFIQHFSSIFRKGCKCATFSPERIFLSRAGSTVAEVPFAVLRETRISRRQRRFSIRGFAVDLRIHDRAQIQRASGTISSR